MRRRSFVTGAICTAAVGTAWAQAGGRVYRIAVVSAFTSESEMKKVHQPFILELKVLGYIEGQNLLVERYTTEGRSENFTDLAKKVVSTKPDVIWAGAARIAVAFKATTSAIPIVATMPDPVAYHVVANLAHPEANITGVSVDAGFEIWSKRLQLLKEVVPNASRIALLASEQAWKGPDILALREAVQHRGLSLLGPPLGLPLNEAEYRRVIAAMAQQGADAVIVSDQPEHLSYGALIAELSQTAGLPTISARREHAREGVLIAYAFDASEIYKQVAKEVDQILRGAKPSEIPFYQVTRFLLVLNLKTVKALGLTIPFAMLARADEVIE